MSDMIYLPRDRRYSSLPKYSRTVEQDQDKEPCSVVIVMVRLVELIVLPLVESVVHMFIALSFI